VKKVLITGGTGCIGAATAAALAGPPPTPSRKGRGDTRAEFNVDEIILLSRSGQSGLLDLWFPQGLDKRIKLLRGDIADPAVLRTLLHAQRPTHIVHLAAFQTPDCDAYPGRGMEINVGGTLQLLSAAAELASAGALERVVFASSAAVYGKRSLYPGATVKETDALAPPNLYGVWKVAGEHLARQFQEKTGVPTVCLRLNTTYGPGRDRGKTSAPTTALKAVAWGAHRGSPCPYRMPYCGRENYHYVADVGAHFALCALEPFAGFGVFNIRGRTVEVREFLELARRVAGELGMGGTVDLGLADNAQAGLFVCDLDDEAIRRAFPGVPCTPLEEGIRSSLEAFARLAQNGKLKGV